MAYPKQDVAVNRASEPEARISFQTEAGRAIELLGKVGGGIAHLSARLSPVLEPAPPQPINGSVAKAEQVDPTRHVMEFLEWVNQQLSRSLNDLNDINNRLVL